MKKRFNSWMIASLVASAVGVFIANKADEISREETKEEIKAELLEELNHENEEES